MEAPISLSDNLHGFFLKHRPNWTSETVDGILLQLSFIGITTNDELMSTLASDGLLNSSLRDFGLETLSLDIVHLLKLYLREDLCIDCAPSWFFCPGCDKLVTELVLGSGPANKELMSQTHCCLKCESGEGHDDIWCCGTPSNMLFQIPVPLPGGERFQRGNFIMHEPNWDSVCSPVPALLFLHGAFTYLWPESLYVEIENLVSFNTVARDFVIIAPLAAIGEPFAVVSETRTVHDRFENIIPYVDSFNMESIWYCFLSVCYTLGPDKVDFSRLLATGFSMGAQAVWDIAMTRGSLFAAVGPMAGRCFWSPLLCENERLCVQQITSLPLKAFSAEDDHGSYSFRDFVWLAKSLEFSGDYSERSLPLEIFTLNGDEIEVVEYSWETHARLCLVRGHDGGHNCWDMVYHAEEDFGLFTWMASQTNTIARSKLLDGHFDVD